ncbi:MAG: ParB N-terminal domain-containing protein, partial [Planctomycetota bacterium]
MDTPASPPVETVAIDRLFCSPTNPRLNDQAVPHVAASIRRFGWQQPIVARRSGEVVAGNTRLKAAQSLGMTEVPVWWFEGSDLDAVAYAIGDNKSHLWSSWDEPALAALLQQLKAEDALDGVGYTEDDIDALVQQLRDQEEVDKQLDDDGPDEPPAVAIAKTGDLWTLGEHKLLCGDSTNLKDVLRVMGSDKAALVATDPPYLVDYTGERPNDSGKDWTATYREIDIKDADGFFRAVFVNVLEVLAHKGAIYCWHAHKRCGDIQRIWCRPRHPRPPTDHLGETDAGVRPRLLALPPRAVRDGLAARRQARARWCARPRLGVGVRLGRQGAILRGPPYLEARRTLRA